MLLAIKGDGVMQRGVKTSTNFTKPPATSQRQLLKASMIVIESSIQVWL